MSCSDKKELWNKILEIGCAILGLIILVLFIVAFICYRNTPVEDLPTWAWWLLRN